jgi:hypothetical protein
LRGAAEQSVEQVPGDLLLDLLALLPRAIDVRPGRLVAIEQPLLGHDLHHLQGRRVLAVLAALHRGTVYAWAKSEVSWS